MLYHCYIPRCELKDLGNKIKSTGSNGQAILLTHGTPILGMTCVASKPNYTTYTTLTLIMNMY